MANGIKMRKTSPFAGMRCPLCGDIESLKVDVETLDLECASCGDTITRHHVEELLSSWTNLYAWLDTAARCVISE